MKLFISWSGERSRIVADAVRGWIQELIQAVDPWMSTEMDKGTRWVGELSGNLEKSPHGIFCVTKENINAPWLCFEAGAIARSPNSRTVTLLIGLDPSDVPFPLAQFQATLATKEDIKRLAETINKSVEAVTQRGLAQDVLDRAFERLWPELERKLKDAAEMRITDSKPARRDRELLEEVLTIVRRLDVTRATPSMPRVVRTYAPSTQVLRNILVHDDDTTESGDVTLSESEYRRVIARAKKLLGEKGDGAGTSVTEMPSA